MVSGHPDVLRDPAPQVRLASFDDSAITYEIQLWNRPAGVSQLDLRSDLLSQIWYGPAAGGPDRSFPRAPAGAPSSNPPGGSRHPSSLESYHPLVARSLFQHLSDPQRHRLLESSQAPCFGPGEVIVREGPEGESLYVVLLGRVEVGKRLEGRAVVVAQLGAGEVFGEMTLFLEAPRSATVRALEECRLLQVGRPAVRALFADDPDLLERLASLVSARQAELERLSREDAHAQQPGLLLTMKRLFAALAGP